METLAAGRSADVDDPVSALHRRRMAGQHRADILHLDEAFFKRLQPFQIVIVTQI